MQGRPPGGSGNGIVGNDPTCMGAPDALVRGEVLQLLLRVIATPRADEGVRPSKPSDEKNAHGAPDAFVRGEVLQLSLRAIATSRADEGVRPSKNRIHSPNSMLYNPPPTAPPISGATQNIHSCCSAHPPTNTATPVLRAGLTLTLVTGMPMR
jgi:hypothetical protein